MHAISADSHDTRMIQRLSNAVTKQAAHSLLSDLPKNACLETDAPVTLCLIVIIMTY